MTQSRSGDSPPSTAGHGVGLVVVSHSRALARAAVALAAEMLHGRPLRIEVAAGLDETTFGTDAVAHHAGHRAGRRPGGRRRAHGSRQRRAQRRAGARPARSDPSVRDRVTLSPAPIVEGLIVAAVAAAGGASRAEVAAEARDALMGKAAHLSDAAEGDAPGAATLGARGGRRRLHGREPARPARPAGRPAGQRGPRARRVGPAAQPHHRRRAGPGRQPEPGRDAGRPARARGRGARLGTAGAGGGRAPADARRAPVRRDRRGASRRLGPGPCRVDAAARCPRHPGSRSARSAGSPRCPSTSTSSRPGSRPRSGGASWSRWPPYAARSSTSGSSPRARWAPSRRASSTRTSPCSPTPRCSPTSRPASAPASGRSPPGPAASPTSSASGPSLPDPYLRERAADVRAVGDQVLRALTGEPARQMTSPRASWSPRDLTPAETAGLDLDLVTGVVLAQGSPTSHAAILARARDIPVVVAAGREVLSVPEGTTVVLDGGTGELHVDPSPELLEEYRAPRRGRGRAARPAARPRRAARRLPRRHARSRGRQPRLGGRRPGRARRRRGRRRAGAHRVPVPRPERRARRRGAAGPSTTRSPRPWTVGGSPCAPSTSEATSRWPTCRCPSRRTRSSVSAASGSASSTVTCCATRWPRSATPRGASRPAS